MNQLNSLFFLCLFTLLFHSCQKKSSKTSEETEPLKIEFDRSSIYISNQCETLTPTRIIIRSKVPTDKNLDFEVKFEDEYLAEWSLAPHASKVVKLMPSFSNNGDFEIEIPPFSKYKKNLIECKVQCITEEFQQFSKSINVEYVDSEQEFEYIELKHGITMLLGQRYWDDYKGDPLPPNRTFVLKHHLKSDIFKEEDRFVQKMDYQLTLVDKETNEKINIKPDLSLRHTFPKALDLKEETKLSDETTDSDPFGDGSQMISQYTTTDELNQMPGYQIYGAYKGDFIKAKFINCDSMTILNKEKLNIPNRLLLKCFPKVE